MTNRKRPPAKPAGHNEATGPTDTSDKQPVVPATQDKKPKMDAFDVWLQRGLHQLYDDVAGEPIPDDLLRLIEEDRSK